MNSSLLYPLFADEASSQLISGVIRLGITFLVIAVIVHLIFKGLRGAPKGRTTASYGSSDGDADGEAIACWRDRYFGAVICVQIFVTVMVLLAILALFNR